tara:strand:+ start:1215 stop:1691 length:477 start_codon:yes stop_codon:yes gene_type:complete
MKLTLVILFIILLVGIDQVSKFLISSQLSLGESFNILPFLSFTLIHNTGIAFSLFDDGGVFSRWLLVTCVFLILLYFFFLLFKKTPKHQLELISLLLIISGGLGNLIDRIFFGHVVDFVHMFYKHYSFYVFNFADSYITIAIFIYLIYFFFVQRREKT